MSHWGSLLKSQEFVSARRALAPAPVATSQMPTTSAAITPVYCAFVGAGGAPERPAAAAAAARARSTQIPAAAPPSTRSHPSAVITSSLLASKGALDPYAAP